VSKSAIRITAVLALGLSVGALADKTYTVLSAGAKVDRMTFTFGPGSDALLVLEAEVCGRSTLSSGGDSPSACHTTRVNAGALRTNILALKNGQALDFWKTQEGL
jgi:hypothetical protein